MPKSIVSSPKIATVPGAPYSPGTKAGNLLFVAGVLALDGNGQIVRARRYRGPNAASIRETSRRSSRQAAAE